MLQWGKIWPFVQRISHGQCPTFDYFTRNSTEWFVFIYNTTKYLNVCLLRHSELCISVKGAVSLHVILYRWERESGALPARGRYLYGFHCYEFRVISRDYAVLWEWLWSELGRQKLKNSISAKVPSSDTNVSLLASVVPWKNVNIHNLSFFFSM